MTGKTLSLWIRGELIKTDPLWSKWTEAVEYLAPEMPVLITHISASSPSFKSDKYLKYSRAKKRLDTSFRSNEEFDYLGFASIPEVVTSMAGDQIFSAVLWKNQEKKEITVEYWEERFPSAKVEVIESMARSFFTSGRLEWYRNDRGDFPCNYRINFHHPNGYKPRGFESLTVNEFR